MREEEVEFTSSLDGATLHGTFSQPPLSPASSKSKTEVNAPPVLMIGGSGKTDRNEFVPAKLTYSGRDERLFAQLNRVLVESGSATFRYDKRGVRWRGGTCEIDRTLWKTADRRHLVQDATDAAHWLLARTQMAPEQLVIVGHSEGTVLAVETALCLGGRVRALLLFGAQARSMKEMLHYQIVESRAPNDSGIGEIKSREEEYEKALAMINTSSAESAPDDKPMNWYRQDLQADANEHRLRLVRAEIAIFHGEIDPQLPSAKSNASFGRSRKRRCSAIQTLAMAFHPTLRAAQRSDRSLTRSYEM